MKRFYRVFDTILFILLLAASSIYVLKLFYRQATSTGPWLSDIKPYIEEMLGTNTKFNFPYPVLFKTAKFVNVFSPSPEMAMAITVCLFNVLAMIIVKVILNKQTGTYLLSTCATFCLFFASMIYGSIFTSFGIVNKYSGVFSPNPWHNHTYMAARPFMILSFVFCAMCLDKYESVFAKDSYITKKDLSIFILFSASLLLTTLTKPSYTLIHGGALFIIIVYRFIKNRFTTFRQSLMFGLFFVPTIMDLLYQYSSVFTGTASTGDEQGIGFGLFRVWSRNVDNIPLAIILAAAFPIVVLALHFKKLKTDSQFRLSWQLFLVGFLSSSLLYEKGFREWHGNFFWGYICGLFVVFLSSIVLLLKDTKEHFLIKGNRIPTIALSIQWLLLFIHTFMGLIYFYRLTVYGMSYV